MHLHKQQNKTVFIKHDNDIWVLITNQYCKFSNNMMNSEFPYRKTCFHGCIDENHNFTFRK